MGNRGTDQAGCRGLQTSRSRQAESPGVDWHYDLVYSWQLGAEVNNPWFGGPERHERFAPWSKAKIAIFYPGPFGRTPHWPEHFIAYVRGAHLIETLPEVHPTKIENENNE